MLQSCDETLPDTNLFNERGNFLHEPGAGKGIAEQSSVR
jgi:hypothetical protein